MNELKQQLTKIRHKLAKAIKPKRQHKTRLGKLGVLSMTEGSDMMNFSLLNNSVKVSVSLKEIIKALK